MTNCYVFIDTNAFGVKNAEAVTAVRSALGIFNQQILQEQCNIENFAVVETDSRRMSDVIVTRARRGLNRRDRRRLQRLSVELIPSLSATDGKTILIDMSEIYDTSSSYDKAVDDLIAEVICRELCHALGVDDRIGIHNFGSKESQSEFGLMYSPYNVYNSNLGKEYFLTEVEIESLKATIAARVA